MAKGSASRTKTAGRADNVAGGSAGIEIVGFPQMLYTRTFGDPDTLFVPLLEVARDSNKMLARLTGLGEERANAVTLSGMQLASSLLRRGQRSKSSLQMGPTGESPAFVLWHRRASPQIVPCFQVDCESREPGRRRLPPKPGNCAHSRAPTPTVFVR